MKPHNWRTTCCRPGRTYFACTHCPVTETWRLKDGKWHAWVIGPKECHG